MPQQTVTVNGEPIPLDDCIWLERHPCGCVASAVIAVVPDAWTLATADDARQHLNRTASEQRRAAEAGLTVEPVSSTRYRNEFRARWKCSQHNKYKEPGA